MSYEVLDERKHFSNGSSHHSDVERPAMRISSSSSVVSSASGASFLRQQRPPDDLAEPLTGDLEEGVAEDPFFVFRGDLVAKLDLVDQGLAEFLRVVHQTVGVLFP